MATKKATDRKKAKPRIPPLTIENAKIIYRNFGGKAKTFNAKGLRNFHVILDPDQARMLEKDGWNIKWPKPREDKEERNPTLKVHVRFDNYPPLIMLITGKSQTQLDEESVDILDDAQIEMCDLKVTGSWYEMDDGKTGYKTYLSQLFVTLSDSDLLAKYYNAGPAKRVVEDSD